MRIAGFGMNSRATADSLAAALRAAGPADALAALESHADRVQPLARDLRLPLIRVALVAGIPTATQSSRSLAAHDTGSVAEAVALVAAGPGARLAAPRVTSPDSNATCAIACAARPDASALRTPAGQSITPSSAEAGRDGARPRRDRNRAPLTGASA